MQQFSDKTLTILEYVRIILRRGLTLSKKRARAEEEISGVNNQGRNRGCFVNLSDLAGGGGGTEANAAFKDEGGDSDRFGH